MFKSFRGVVSLSKSLSAYVLGLGLLSSLGSVQAQTFSFALWGDMPYQKAGDAPKIPALIKSINQSDVDFSIYDGDLKDGSSLCLNSTFDDGLKMFNSLQKPAIYSPGDNEWTDCHRTNNGGYDTLERLRYLRKVMFPTLNSLGQQQMPLIHQGALGEKFVENVRFTYKNVVFVTLNMPGSNNNKVEGDEDCTYKSARTLAQCDADNVEYLERDAANIAWIRQAFAEAKKTKAIGLVMAFQADPEFAPTHGGKAFPGEPELSGYKNFMAAVIQETEKYAGQVLLVHGDSHFFRLDKPFYHHGELLTNITRLETFGSPLIHWVHVSVDPTNPNVFTVQPVIVKQ